jgi:ankyrin repeat protein
VKKRYPDINIKSLNYKNLYIKTIKEILKLKIRYNFEFLKGNPEKYLKIFSNPLKYEYRAYLISKYNYKDVFYMLYTQDRDHFLDGAASGGQLELIKEWISDHNFTVSNYDTALCSAIKNNRRAVIDLFLSLGAKDYREFLIEAVKYNHQDLVNLFQSLI